MQSFLMALWDAAERGTMDRDRSLELSDDDIILYDLLLDEPAEDS